MASRYQGARLVIAGVLAAIVGAFVLLRPDDPLRE